MKHKSEKVGRERERWTDKITLGRRGEGGREEGGGEAEEEKKRGRERGEGGGRGRESWRDCRVISLHPPAYQLPWQQYPTEPGGTTWLASLAGREEKGRERREGRRDNIDI